MRSPHRYILDQDISPLFSAHLFQFVPDELLKSFMAATPYLRSEVWTAKYVPTKPDVYSLRLALPTCYNQSMPANPTDTLQKAALNGRLDEVKHLLEAGADSKAGNSYALRCAAKNGHLEVVELLLPVSDPKANDSWALRMAAQSGHLEIVKLLLPVSDPKTYDSSALQRASENDHLEIVKLLLPVSDPQAVSSLALRLAAQNGHLEIVKLLLPVSDPKADNSCALQWAATNGHQEIIKLLMPVSDPKADDSLALRLAAGNGHLEIVKLLLPVSDPKADDSLALQWACESGFVEIVRLLLPYSDLAKALKDPDFVRSHGCDVLLSCLSVPFAKQFMVDNPGLNLPRTTAMLAAQALSHRRVPTKQATCKRHRA